MKHVFKKSMMVAGVLACLFASSAFAQTVTTTPEQDKATQAAAVQANKDYDAAHGYKNESAAEFKEEAAERKAEEKKAELNAAVERDKETQAEAVKENKDYDKAHGYTNGAPAEAAPAAEAPVPEVPAAPTEAAPAPAETPVAEAVVSPAPEAPTAPGLGGM